MYSKRFAQRSLFLAVLFTITVSTPTLAQKTAYMAAQRLRVRVESNTLRSGQATKVFVEFLDRNYQRVPTDLPRVIQLSQNVDGLRQAGSGEFYPRQIKIAKGAWSAEGSFASRQPGKLLIVATSYGLDPGQVLVMVTKQSSWLAGLFETVAYAEEAIEVFPKDSPPATANNTSAALFYVSIPETTKNAVTVRVLTKPATRVVYQNKESFAFVDIRLDESKRVSDEIGIISRTPQAILIEAWALPHGTKDSATFKFVSPRPHQILFEAEPRFIASYQRNVPISVQLADDGGFPVQPDREQQIRLDSASDSEFIAFEPAVILVSPTQPSAQAMMRLNDLPEGNELKILATSSNLKHGEKTIVIESLIEQLLVTGPSEVGINTQGTEFTIRLADKNGRARKADWNRKIVFSVDGGAVDKSSVVISRGAESTTVKYNSPGGVGRTTLIAYSDGINEGKFVINVVTPMYWLIIAALLGGSIGGAVRHMTKDFKLERVVPRYENGNLELGLLGHVASSLVCGMVFFLVYKLGLSKAFGAAGLPASFEFGTRSVALLFGVIGGFAGTIVLDKLVEYFLAPKQKEVTKGSSKPEERKTKLVQIR